MCASRLERPETFGLQLKLKFIHVTLLLRSYKCFCASNWLWYKCYKIQLPNMVGGNIPDLAPACMLISSFTIPGATFYPPEPLRSLLLPPHIMMCFPPCLCSHSPLHTSPHSSHLSQIYLSFENLLSSYVFYQFSLSPQAPSGLGTCSRSWNKV